LIGEAADAETVAAVQKLVQEHPAVIQARRPVTMHLSPKEVFLALDVQFNPDLPASEIVKVIDELEQKIHQEHNSVGQIFIEVERLKESEHTQNIAIHT
jgi:divalent metal cation (Fe/Co/Zn/Cd) transporter